MFYRRALYFPPLHIYFQVIRFPIPENCQMYLCAFFPFNLPYDFRQFQALHGLLVYHINHIAVTQPRFLRRSAFEHTADISHPGLGIHSYISADTIINPFRLIHQICQIFFRIIGRIGIPQRSYYPFIHPVNQLWCIHIFLIIVFFNSLLQYFQLAHRLIIHQASSVFFRGLAHDAFHPHLMQSI